LREETQLDLEHFQGESPTLFAMKTLTGLTRAINDLYRSDDPLAGLLDLMPDLRELAGNTDVAPDTRINLITKAMRCVEPIAERREYPALALRALESTVHDSADPAR
jgi:hypothetical protein